MKLLNLLQKYRRPFSLSNRQSDQLRQKWIRIRWSRFWYGWCFIAVVLFMIRQRTLLILDEDYISPLYQGSPFFYSRFNSYNHHSQTYQLSLPKTNITEHIQENMKQDEAWYNTCQQDNGTSRKSNVPRACPGLMTTSNDNNDIEHQILEEYQCSVTEGIELVINQDASSLNLDVNFSTSTTWTIRTIDGQANYKTIGGDEFYVMYTEYTIDPNSLSDDVHDANITAVAMIKDRQNGTYGLDFVTVPTMSTLFPNVTTRNPASFIENENSYSTNRRGRLDVFLQYTCSMGTLPQPLKDGWRTGGATNLSFTLDNVPQRPPIESWQERLERRGGIIRNPPIQSRNSNSNTNQTTTTAVADLMSLTKFRKSIFFGDSLMAQMVMNYQHPVIFYHPTKTLNRGNADVTLTNNTLQKVFNKLKTWHWIELRRYREDATLVVGSAAWDLMLSTEYHGTTFEKHLQACRDFIAHIRKTYPGVNIIWRLPTAIHIHRADSKCFSLEDGSGNSKIENKRNRKDMQKNNKEQSRKAKHNPCVDILRYASTSRIEYLYQKQLELMLYELSIPVIDVYEISYLSSHFTKLGDAIHYTEAWNSRILLEFLYQDDYQKPSNVKLS